MSISYNSVKTELTNKEGAQSWPEGKISLQQLKSLIDDAKGKRTENGTNSPTGCSGYCRNNNFADPSNLSLASYSASIKSLASLACSNDNYTKPCQKVIVNDNCTSHCTTDYYCSSETCGCNGGVTNSCVCNKYYPNAICYGVSINNELCEVKSFSCTNVRGGWTTGEVISGACDHTYEDVCNDHHAYCSCLQQEWCRYYDYSYETSVSGSGCQNYYCGNN